MKKNLLAFALFASAATAFAHDGDKPAKGKKADHCTGAAAAKCEKGMTAGASMEGMPACCRAKMAAAKAAAPATATTKAPVKSM
ncbi:MAG: hypothetical protein EOO62_08560 [Hymenobacter sp.]|nr:MAG: hypothetical protein EOO62_08560 [Hymenobacter sp.]